mmetsp:Transcript_52529/g.122946  ORF Transcript_52529/g.122946 Transcript_52529/m.122946 type:complete len:591 (-) Transcript_52529:118-1890(-)
MVAFHSPPKTHPAEASLDESRENSKEVDHQLLDKPQGSMLSEDNSEMGLRDSDQDPGSVRHRRGNSDRRNAQSLRKIELKDSAVARLADSDKFMNTTLCVIVLNAMWIGIDTEWNHKALEENDSLPLEPWSDVVEWAFCIYFSAEVVVRFLAFKHKCDGWRDRWFVFDSILVVFMVTETWVLPLVAVALQSGTSGAGLRNLSTLRILRLSRIVKMARSIEALRTLVKGMISAIRAVVFILLFLVLITYVFAIIFTTQLACVPSDDCYEDPPPVCEDIAAGDDTYAPCMFGDLGSAMMTLFTNGMLGDNLYQTLDVIKEAGTNSAIYMYWLFIIFFGISALTLLNMLIGVLCDTISNTANNERRNYQVDNFKANMSDAFKKIDVDQSGYITFAEWKKIKDEEDVKRFLADDFEIDEDEVTKTMGKMETVIFSDGSLGGGRSSLYSDSEYEEDKGLTHETFIKHMIELRPDRKATPLDIEMLKDCLERNHKTMQENFAQIVQGIGQKWNQKPASLQRYTPPPPPAQAPPAHSSLRSPSGQEVSIDDVAAQWLQKVPSEVLFFVLQKRAAHPERGVAWSTPHTKAFQDPTAIS